MAKYRIGNMERFLDATRALSDGSRVRILMALRRGELCLCQIIDLLGLAPSTVSKHMSVLKAAGLVRGRKEGRWHYYRLAGDDAPEIIRSTIRWMEGNLLDDETIAADAQGLEAVLRKDREELCAHYRR